MLEKQGLERLPQDIVDNWSSTVRMIQLNDNELHKDTGNTLADLQYCTLLEHINLNNNKLVKIPVEIFNLQHVTFLDLGKNKLTKLPKELLQLEEITHFCLSDNQLDKGSLKFVVDLGTLTSLDLVSNKLSDSGFPSKLNLPLLENLDLAANLFSSVPSTICMDLPNLKSLTMSSNGIRGIAPEIGKLSRLTSLDLSSNNIQVRSITVSSSSIYSNTSY